MHLSEAPVAVREVQPFPKTRLCLDSGYSQLFGHCGLKWVRRTRVAESTSYAVINMLVPSFLSNHTFKHENRPVRSLKAVNSGATSRKSHIEYAAIPRSRVTRIGSILVLNLSLLRV